MINLTPEQKTLISIYKMEIKQNLDKDIYVKLNLIGKDFEDQKIDLIKYAKDERIPKLEQTLINLEEQKTSVQLQINTINKALFDWQKNGSS